MKREHPIFAFFFETMSRPVEWFNATGMARMRSRLVSGLRGRIIEVGCGNGLNFGHYARGTEIVGIEPDSCMLRRAVPRAQDAEARVFVVAADGEELPFAPGAFDAAVCCLVLCTIPNAPRALAELRRVLKPGGQLYFVEHVRARSGVLAAVQDRVDRAWAWVFAGCHPNRETRSMIEHAGFRIDAMSEWPSGIVIRGRAVAE